MPTSPDQRTKANLRAAATFLREAGQTEYAQTVEGILTPAGAATLRRLVSEHVGMSIYLTRVEENHLRRAVAESGTTLDAVAEDILRGLVDGSFRPAAGVKLPYNSGSVETSSSLNFKVPADLKEQATHLIKTPAFAAELGWKPRGASVLVRTGFHHRFPLIPEADLPALVTAYQEGATLTEVAERFGADPDVVSLALELQGVSVREKEAWRAERGNTARTLSKAEAVEVARRYQEPDEESAEALAAEFGVHVNTIYAALDREGVERRPIAVLTDAQREEIARRARADASLTAKALAAEYGVSAMTISRVLHKAGIERRRGRAKKG